MPRLLKDNLVSSIIGWAALIAAAWIFLLVSLGSQYHQLAIGLVVSSMVIPALMLVFETLWWIAMPRSRDQRMPSSGQ